MDNGQWTLRGGTVSLGQVRRGDLHMPEKLP
jgi:hypothetical protein